MYITVNWNVGNLSLTTMSYCTYTSDISFMTTDAPVISNKIALTLITMQQFVIERNCTCSMGNIGKTCGNFISLYPDRRAFE